MWTDANTHTHTSTAIYPLNSVMNVNNELGNTICYVVSRLWPWEHGRIQCSNEMTNIENWKRITQRERRETRQQQMHKKKINKWKSQEKRVCDLMWTNWQTNCNA